MIGNATYRTPADLPEAIPVFPLAGALLLPRGQLPLNIFEPRYIAMVDAALADARVIGMIQPRLEVGASSAAEPPLFSVGCVGRITSFSETGDGRYLITLTGIARFRTVGKVGPGRPYRSARIEIRDFTSDFVARAGEVEVDRAGLLVAFRAYLDANNLQADWDSVRSASTEALVNALSMMSPFGPSEKQALLEAPDLKTRAATLVAIAEMAVRSAGGDPPSLQ